MALAATSALELVDDEDRQRIYFDTIRAALPVAARALLEDHVIDIANYKFKSDFAREFIRQGRKEGRQEGRVAALREAIQVVLAARGESPSGSVSARLEACIDPARLTHWLEDLAHGGSVSELTGDDPPSRAGRSAPAD